MRCATGMYRSGRACHVFWLDKPNYHFKSRSTRNRCPSNNASERPVRREVGYGYQRVYVLLHREGRSRGQYNAPHLSRIGLAIAQRRQIARASAICATIAGVKPAGTRPGQWAYQRGVTLDFSLPGMPSS